MGLHPFYFCEQNATRRHFWHSTINILALMRCMEILANIVKEKMKAILPDRLAIVFDGWTGGESHYVSVFATFPSDQPKSFECVMLSIAPMRDEDS